MKIGIAGLGAVGGFLGARLARSGAQVCALARGETLAAVRGRGLTLIEQNGQSFSVPVRASDQAAELGVQDLLIISVKTTGLNEVARRLAPMIGTQTRILSAMNGIPWWFFDGFSGDQTGGSATIAAPDLPATSTSPATSANYVADQQSIAQRTAQLAAVPLASVDPAGELRRLLPARQVIGSVTHFSCSSPQPGLVQQKMGERLIIGEPHGGDPHHSPSCAASIAAFTQAGFQVDASRCIQKDIWFKLWGNMTVNPISAITGATGDRILDDREVKDFMSRCMLEANNIGEQIGLPIGTTPDERHAVTRKLGAFRTSMLQDVESGRPIELDALLASVIEIGTRIGIARPNLDALMGLTRLTARSRGLYPN